MTTPSYHLQTNSPITIYDRFVSIRITPNHSLFYYITFDIFGVGINFYLRENVHEMGPAENCGIKKINLDDINYNRLDEKRYKL